MNVLMVGVDKNRVGGMWTVAETFINNEWFNKKVNLYYVATAILLRLYNSVSRL